MLNIFQAEINDSTLDDIKSAHSNRKRRRLRRAAVLAVAVIVVAALLGLFDQEQTVVKDGDSFTAEAQLPTVIRAGNEIELRIEITAAEPLPETVTLELDEDYLMLFEDFSAFPEPESVASGAGGTIQFEVAPVPGSRQMVATLTGRASDQWSPSTDGVLGIKVNGNTTELEIRTWRIP